MGHERKVGHSLTLLHAWRRITVAEHTSVHSSSKENYLPHSSCCATHGAHNCDTESMRRALSEHLLHTGARTQVCSQAVPSCPVDEILQGTLGYDSSAGHTLQAVHEGNHVIPALHIVFTVGHNQGGSGAGGHLG